MQFVDSKETFCLVAPLRRLWEQTIKEAFAIYRCPC